MNARTVTAILFSCITFSLSCAPAATDISTGGFALSGVAVVRGRVLTTAGAPLDSFRVWITFGPLTRPPREYTEDIIIVPLVR